MAQKQNAGIQHTRSCMINQLVPSADSFLSGSEMTQKSVNRQNIYTHTLVKIAIACHLYHCVTDSYSLGHQMTQMHSGRVVAMLCLFTALSLSIEMIQFVGQWSIYVDT